MALTFRLAVSWDSTSAPAGRTSKLDVRFLLVGAQEFSSLASLFFSALVFFELFSLSKLKGVFQSPDLEIIDTLHGPFLQPLRPRQ